MSKQTYTIYRSRRFLFRAKRINNASGRHVLCMFLPRSGAWVPFLSEPEYATKAAAEARLDKLAKLNHWQRVDSMGFPWSMGK